MKDNFRLPFWFEEVGRLSKVALVAVLLLLVVFQVQIYKKGATENPLMPEASPLSETLPVNYSDERLFANICLEVIDCDSLPQAFVAINGRSSGNFTQKEVTVRVYEGDVVEINTSAYQPAIHFRVKNCSANLDQSQWPQDLSSQEGKAVLGQIKFK